MRSTSWHQVQTLGASSVLALALGCAPASLDENAPLGWIRQAECSDHPDKVEAVSSYDGALGVSADFVDEHARPVGGESNPDCLERCWLGCTGTLISRDLFLTDSGCFNQHPFLGVEDVGFGWPEVRYHVDSVEETGLFRYTILKLAGSPGDDWGVARLSALAVPPGQLVASIFRSDRAAPELKTGTVAYGPAILADPGNIEFHVMTS